MDESIRKLIDDGKKVRPISDSTNELINNLANALEVAVEVGELSESTLQKIKAIAEGKA